MCALNLFSLKETLLNKLYINEIYYLLRVTMNEIEMLWVKEGHFFECIYSYDLEKHINVLNTNKSVRIRKKKP